MFDAFVVAASLAIDLAFLDGIWEMENFVDSAMLLVILLPWRVVRIVNSKLMFVIISYFLFLFFSILNFF